MKPFSKLLQSRKFWLAVLALLQTVVFLLRPSFPPELWAAVNEVLIVLIVSVTVENVATFVAAGIGKDNLYATRAISLTDGQSRLPWLLKSRKFWLAVVALAQTAIFSSMPDFPPELWDGINTVLLIVIGLYAVEDATQSISSAVASRSS